MATVRPALRHGGATAEAAVPVPITITSYRFIGIRGPPQEDGAGPRDSIETSSTRTGCEGDAEPFGVDDGDSPRVDALQPLQDVGCPGRKEPQQQGRRDDCSGDAQHDLGTSLSHQPTARRVATAPLSEVEDVCPSQPEHPERQREPLVADHRHHQAGAGDTCGNQRKRQQTAARREHCRHHASGARQSLPRPRARNLQHRFLSPTQKIRRRQSPPRVPPVPPCQVGNARPPACRRMTPRHRPHRRHPSGPGARPGGIRLRSCPRP